MAAGYDGSIRIDTKINTNGFNAGTKQINNGLAGITKSLKGLAVAVGVAFGVGAVVNFAKASVKAATDLSNALIGLQSIMDGQGRNFAEAQKFINSYTKDGLIPATQAITAYKNLALRGYDDTQIQQVMLALKDSASFGRQASYSLGQAVESATEGLKNENSILVDNAGVTKNVAKMWDDYAKSIGTTTNNLTQQQKIQAEVNGILEETKYQAGDAAKVAENYSGQILKLGYNFNNLKIAVGNALIPIARAVLPGLNAIISSLTRIMNLFAQVTTALFGEQATKQKEVSTTALAGAKAENSLAKATKKAGDATEKAGKKVKGALANFDELNVLAQDTAENMESAADDIGVTNFGTDMGTAVDSGVIGDIEVSPEIQNFIDGLKDRFRDLAPYTDRTGEAWGRFKQALVDFITAPGVQAVLGFLKEMALIFIERFIERGLLVLAGALDILSGALNIVAGFLSLVIGLLTGDFNMALDGAKQMIEGLKLILLGFGEIIEGVLVFLLGRDAVEAMKAFALAGIEIFLEWFGTMDEVITGFKTALTGLIEFLCGVFSGNWGQAWEGIKKIFKGVFEALKGIVKGEINLIITFINKMIDAITSGLNFLISSMNKLSFDVPKWVEKKFGISSFGFNIDPVIPFKIPKLATGAVIPPNSEFAAILGDQKHGRNLEAPEDLIRQIVREETEGLGGENITVVADGDVGQLVRFMRFRVEKENRRRGKSLIKGGPVTT